MDNSEVRTNNFSASPTSSSSNSFSSAEKKYKKKKNIITVISISIFIIILLSVIIILFILPRQTPQATQTVSEESKTLAYFNEEINNFLFNEEKDRESWEIEEEILEFIERTQDSNQDVATSARLQLARLYFSTDRQDIAINYLENALQDSLTDNNKYQILSYLVYCYENNNMPNEEISTIQHILLLQNVNLKGESWDTITDYYKDRLVILETK